jgi:hypothetical protein
MATNAVIVTGVTDPATGSFSLTSPGFGTVQAAIVISSNAEVSDNPSTGSGTIFSIGFWDGVNSFQGCTRTILTNGVGTTDTTRVQFTDRIISWSSTTPRYLTCSAITDGLEFTHNAIVPTDRVRYITAIFFNGLTNVKGASYNMGATTAEQNINTVGFKPDLVFFMTAGLVTNGSFGDDGLISFGVAHNNSSDVISQCVMLAGSGDAKASGDPYMRSISGKVLGQIIDATTSYTGEVSNFDAEGFSLTTNASTASDKMLYLALELANPDDAWVSLMDAATSTGNSATTGVGFQPQVLGLVGGLTTDETMHTKMSFSFGASDGTAERSIAIYDEDLADPTNCANEADLSNVLAIYDDDGTDLATASLSSMDSDGFTLNYTLAGSAYKILTFAVGDSTAGDSIAVTGVAGTGAVGSVSVSVDESIAVTGVAGTGAVGSVSVSVDDSIAVTGVAGTGAVGSVSVSVNESIAVTGVAGTGAVGDVSAYNVLLNGIATAPYSSSSYSSPFNVPTVTANVVSVFGVAGTGAVGSVSVSVDESIAVTGVAGTGDVGSVSVSVDDSIAVTGVAGTGAVGSVSVSVDDSIAVTGVAGTGAVGTVTTSVDAIEEVTGVGAAGGVGSVTVTAEINVYLTPTGIEGIGEVGSVVIVGWFDINDSQIPNWAAIDDSQTPNWAAIDDSQTPSWVDVNKLI